MMLSANKTLGSGEGQKSRTPRHRQRARRWLATSLGIVGLAVLTVYILGPLVMTFIWAFARSWYAPALLPQGYTFKWWRSILLAPHLAHSIVLSFMIAPVVTLAAAVICLPAAYAYSRYRYRGRKSFLISIFAINAFPKMGIYITLAELFYGLHLIGTFPGVVIIQMLGTIVTMTWIPAASFGAVPRELEEASRDSGASAFTTFFRVTLVQARAGLIIAFILTVLASLDEAQGTLVVGAPTIQTMPVIMYSLISGYPEQATAVFSIILTIPSLILLLLVRKYIVGGAFASAFRLQ